MTDFYLNIQQNGNKILVRSVEDGRRRKYEVNYKPYLFAPSSSEEDTKYKTIFGKKAEMLNFDSIREAKKFISEYEDIDNFEMFGMTDFKYVFMNDKFPETIKHDRDMINFVTLDIETMSDTGFPNVREADKEMTAITISDTEKFVVLATKDYVPHKDNIRFIKCSNEKELLLRFIEVWLEFNPDIISGWNSQEFDIPYIINRIIRILGKKYAEKLSPWGIIRERIREVYNKEVQTYEILGVTSLDYKEVYKKWIGKPRESFKLDHIAEVELGLGKLDYSEYGSLHGLYEKNHQLYIEYNVRDTEIINQLDKKLKFIDLVLAISYDSKINFADAFTTVKMWDVITHNYLMSNNIVVPNKINGDTGKRIVGGYVKEPYVGFHEWVCSFDLNSLYPNLIIQYQISPEKFVGMYDGPGCNVDDILNGSFKDPEVVSFREENNVNICPNGAMFKRDEQGFFPYLMENKYSRRKSVKKEMIEQKKLYEKTKDEKYNLEANRLDKLQLALKIQLNAAYGALANPYFRWYDNRLAEAVTTSGQLSIRWVANALNRKMRKNFSEDEKFDWVIAIDTDSCYLRLGEIVNKYVKDKTFEEKLQFIDDFCSQKLEPFIKKQYDILHEYMYSYNNRMVMAREVIANRGIWTAKKKYILNVYDDEGVRLEEPYLKMMGIEAIRSSTPNVVRDKIKESLRIMMEKENEDLLVFIKEFKKEFKKLPFEKVAFPRGLNNMWKYADPVTTWKKGTPIQVKGAFVFNKILKERELENSYQELQDGDKIKFSYMKMPNPTRQKVLTVADELPRELSDLEEYIDYDTQFEKTYLKPIRIITDKIGWRLKKINKITRHVK